VQYSLLRSWKGCALQRSLEIGCDRFHVFVDEVQ